MGMAHDYGTVRGLVEGAIPLGGAEREAFLDTRCAGNAALREEVDAILDGGARNDEFLAAPGAAISQRSGSVFNDVPLAEGTHVGPFRIVRAIAAGGMGIVYEAAQANPARRVALKMARRALDAESVRRFRLEVSVLGGLQHPNIAQVYEAGVHVDDRGASPREIPWFAMELLEDARTITNYADSKALPIRARIALFLAVCDGVHLGHQKGVIHRDLKPDNILVDRFGRVRIIDFGIARAIDSELDLTTMQTEEGLLLGTIPFMSPEQVAGNRGALDTRSDIYALGVVLYRLLTGRLPFDDAKRPLPEIARAICEDPPARPSTAAPGLRGDLETILLKALEKEPARRYKSAEAFADDLRRYLERRPIEARPPSAAYQLSLFARRHAWIVGSLAAVAAILVAATVVSGVFAVQATSAKDAAFAQKKAADAARAQSDLLFTTLLDRSVRDMKRTALETHDLVGGASVSRAQLASALSILETLESIAKDNVAVQASLIATRLELGSVLGDPAHPNLGDVAGARRCYEEALKGAQDLLKTDPNNPQLLRNVSMVDRGLSNLALTENDFDRALSLALDAVDRATALVAMAPASKALRKELGLAHDASYVALARLKRLPEAEEHMKRYLEIFAELAAADPNDRSFRDQVAFGYDRVGGFAYLEKRYEEAAEAYDKAKETMLALAAAEPRSQLYRSRAAYSTLRAGHALLMAKKLDGAEADLSDAVERYENLVRDDPKNRQMPLMLADGRLGLGGVYYARADALGLAGDDARALLERAKGMYGKALEAIDALAVDGTPVAEIVDARKRIQARITQTNKKLEGK
jgi:serine/threonine protein kinase